MRTSVVRETEFPASLRIQACINTWANVQMTRGVNGDGKRKEDIADINEWCLRSLTCLSLFQRIGTFCLRYLCRGVEAWCLMRRVNTPTRANIGDKSLRIYGNGSGCGQPLPPQWIMQCSSHCRQRMISSILIVATRGMQLWQWNSPKVYHVSHILMISLWDQLMLQCKSKRSLLSRPWTTVANHSPKMLSEDDPVI